MKQSANNMQNRISSCFAPPKIIKIFFKLCNLNFKMLLIYRVNFLMVFFMMGMWVISFVILVLVIFQHVETLAGFEKGEVLLILSFYYFFQNLSDIFFKNGFEHFSYQVRRGLFDLKLTKPVPKKFFTFFYEMDFAHLAATLLTVAMFWYSFGQLSKPVSPAMLLIGFFLALISLWLYFSLLLIVAALTFWVSKNETLNMLMWHVMQVSRYPRQIYRGVFEKIVTFGLPLALLAAVPAEVSLQIAPAKLIIYFLGIAIIFAFISNIFWKIGLKRYTSAA